MVVPARIADDPSMERFADMFVDAGSDPRSDPPARGDERATIVGFLRWQRQTLELKCSGLDPAELARRAVDPSTLSLLGVVRHMADVERGWFRPVMAGQDAPRRYSSATDPDGDFDGAAPDPEVVAEAWDAWREEVAFADRLVAEAPDLGVTGKDPYRGAISLRWVLVHMIEEYAVVVSVDVRYQMSGSGPWRRRARAPAPVRRPGDRALLGPRPDLTTWRSGRAAAAEPAGRSRTSTAPWPRRRVLLG
jgi:Protein of unknown function (DUF664)